MRQPRSTSQERLRFFVVTFFPRISKFTLFHEILFENCDFLTLRDENRNRGWKMSYFVDFCILSPVYHGGVSSRGWW